MGPGHWQLDSARRRLLNLHSENHSLDELEKNGARRRNRTRAILCPPCAWRSFMSFKVTTLGGAIGWSKRPRFFQKTSASRAKSPRSNSPWAIRKPLPIAIDKVLVMRPDDGDIIFLRAEVSALLGQEADAEKRVEDYLAAHKDDDAADARTMEFYRRMRLSAPLERRLSAAFLAHPDDEQAASELARFYLEQRRDAEAAECLLRFEGSRLDPQDAAAAAFRFSELLKGSGAEEDLRRWARTAFEKDPSRPEYALRLADLLQAEGQTDAMVEVLRQACESSKKCAASRRP